MRIAICFSGQPRFVRECHDNIKKFIIDPNSSNQIDIFVHTWFSNEICEKVLYENHMSSFSGDSKIPNDVIESIQNLYSPKLMLVEEPINFNVKEEHINSFCGFIKRNSDNIEGTSIRDFNLKKSNDVFSMMHSLNKSVSLKRQIEIEDGFRYDLVLRLRFDNIPTREILLNNYNLDFLYSQEMGKPHFEISDWLNFSSSDNMDILGSIYDSMEKIIENSNLMYGGWSAESLFKSICQINSIQDRTLYLNTRLPQWGKI